MNMPKITETNVDSKVHHSNKFYKQGVTDNSFAVIYSVRLKKKKCF